MKKIIFLDFDGVMDTDKYDAYLIKMKWPENDKYGTAFDPDCVRNLKRIIDETGADIVVSSTWKDFMTYKEILEMWEYRKLPGFVTDTTPTCDYKRGNEIDRWLAECHRPCNYVIIDDMDRSQFNPHQFDRLFVVDPYDGLNEETTDKIIRVLNHSSWFDLKIINRMVYYTIMKCRMTDICWWVLDAILALLLWPFMIFEGIIVLRKAYRRKKREKLGWIDAIRKEREEIENIKL